MSACQENRNMERDIRSNIKEARTKNPGNPPLPGLHFSGHFAGETVSETLKG